MAVAATVLPASTSAGPAGSPDRRSRVLLIYELDGDLRFLAHHDELRMLQRALVRAAWPLAYSHGFNPRPKLTVLLPRNLGCAAAEQVARVELSEPRSGDVLFDSLAAQLPADCRLRRVITPAARATPHPQGAVYELELDGPDLNGLAKRVASVLASPTAVVARESAPGQPTRPFDVRPYIKQLELRGNALRMELLFVEQRTARPAEIITVLGLAADAYYHRVRRAAVHWDMELAGPEGPASSERIALGYEENDCKEAR
jgi:radical SAM-linked protein